MASRAAAVLAPSNSRAARATAPAQSAPFSFGSQKPSRMIRSISVRTGN